MKKELFILLCWLPFALQGQIAFTYPDGAIAGRSKVVTLPASLFSPGVPQGQMLVFYPPAYKLGKLCGLIVFSPGDGEQTGLDVTLVNKNSLPRMIAAGMTPYSLLPNKDTLWWVVCTIHNNAGSSYRTQLDQILPWIWDKAGIIYDPRHVWLSGLSGGGSATWASVMIDTVLSRRITGIIPMANGGYDNFLPTLQGNLITACKQGVYFFPYIGTQDPGYNGSGFFAYDALCRTYTLPDHYHPHIIVGGTHDASVWDVPFNSRIIWDSLGLIGYSSPIPTPKLMARISIDSTLINSPNSLVHITGDSSTGIVTMFQWLQVAGPTKAYWQAGAGSNMVISGLFPGTYRFELYLNDSTGNTDSAFVNVVVKPVAIPPQRTVQSISASLINGVTVWTITYTDGYIETKSH